MLLIDPDGMGRDWVERRRRSGLVTVSSTQSRPRMPAIKQGAHSLGAGSVGITTNNSVSLEDSLRRCMSTGTALLVCDVGDSIPSVVRQAAVWLHRHASQPDTRADLSHLYGSSSVSLGSCPINGIEVEVCEGFELYIDCLVRAPTIDPEMSSCTSVVNFGASFPALRSALLDTIIDCEHPDVNARKQALLATSHALECEV